MIHQDLGPLTERRTHQNPHYCLQETHYCHDTQSIMFSRKQEEFTLLSKMWSGVWTLLCSLLNMLLSHQMLSGWLGH